jgi:hypothetical protein
MRQHRSLATGSKIAFIWLITESHKYGVVTLTPTSTETPSGLAWARRRDEHVNESGAFPVRNLPFPSFATKSDETKRFFCVAK